MLHVNDVRFNFWIFIWMDHLNEFLFVCLIFINLHLHLDEFNNQMTKILIFLSNHIFNLNLSYINLIVSLKYIYIKIIFKIINLTYIN